MSQRAGQEHEVTYDHGKKAGNQGDVIKHVALIAALDGMLSAGASIGTPFRFADLFAGYAKTNLPPNGEWPQGIGVAAERLGIDRGPRNKHVLDWAAYLGQTVGAGNSYPGSSLIARDVILRNRRRPKLAMWDIAPAPLESLRSILGSCADWDANVHDKPALATHPDVLDTDFLLLDPPDVLTHGDPCLSLLEGVRRSVQKPFLVWLPITVKTGKKGVPATWSGTNMAVHARATDLGYHGTVVLWATGGRIMGCELLYSFDQADPVRKAIRDAVDDVVKLLSWKVTKTLPTASASIQIENSVWHSL